SSAGVSRNSPPGSMQKRPTSWKRSNPVRRLRRRLLLPNSSWRPCPESSVVRLRLHCPPVRSTSFSAPGRTRRQKLTQLRPRTSPPDLVLFRVTGIEVPKLDIESSETKRLVETLNRTMSEDMFGEYVGQLESEVGVTINQAALNQAIGIAGSSDVN